VNGVEAPLSRDLLFLSPLSRFGDEALLLMRLAIGAFLIYGVWDNIADAARMQEFIGFLTKFGFPAPELLRRSPCGRSFFAASPSCWSADPLGGVVVRLQLRRFAIAMWTARVACWRVVSALCLILMSLYWATYGAGSLQACRPHWRTLQGRRGGGLRGA
jgi:putative oxidoreductase